MRQRDFKFIGAGATQSWVLYNVAKDPRELRPLGKDSNAARKRLRALLDQHVARMSRAAQDWGNAESARLTSDELERLRSLGYIEGASRGRRSPADP